MKKTVIVLVIAILLGSVLAHSVDKETVKQIRRLLQNNQFKQADSLLEQSVKKSGWHLNLLQLKYYLLIKLQRESEVLPLFDLGLKTFKSNSEKREILKAKFHYLIGKKKIRTALSTVLQLKSLTKNGDKYFFYRAAEASMLNMLPDEAKKMLSIAAERGFLNYRFLEKTVFAPLWKDKQFIQIKNRIKQNIGLNRPAKDFTIPLMDGKNFRLADQKGKVILIHFWASWCKPCLKTNRFLKEHYPGFKKQGYEIIGISLDQKKSDLERYLIENRLPWPVSCDYLGWETPVVKEYGISTVPSLWLIDKAGIVRAFDPKKKALLQGIKILIEKDSVSLQD